LRISEFAEALEEKGIEKTLSLTVADGYGFTLSVDTDNALSTLRSTVVNGIVCGLGVKIQHEMSASFT